MSRKKTDFTIYRYCQQCGVQLPMNLMKKKAIGSYVKTVGSGSKRIMRKESILTCGGCFKEPLHVGPTASVDYEIRSAGSHQ